MNNPFLIQRKNKTVYLPAFVQANGKCRQVACYSKNHMQSELGVHNSFLYMKKCEDQHNLYSIKVYQEDSRGVFLVEMYPEFVAQAVKQSGVLCIEESKEQMMSALIIRYKGRRASHLCFSKKSLVEFLEDRDEVMDRSNNLSITCSQINYCLGAVLAFTAEAMYCDKHGRIMLDMGEEYLEHRDSSRYFAYDPITDGHEYFWHPIEKSVFKKWRKSFMEGYNE